MESRGKIRVFGQNIYQCFIQMFLSRLVKLGFYFLSIGWRLTETTDFWSIAIQIIALNVRTTHWSIVTFTDTKLTLVKDFLPDKYERYTIPSYCVLNSLYLKKIAMRKKDLFQRGIFCDRFSLNHFGEKSWHPGSLGTFSSF